jgi:phosphatidylcholine synthase
MKYSRKRQIAAWLVHIFTALGAAAGLMALIDISQHAWIRAFMWIAVTLVIDSADGGLARLVKVKDVLPRIDGALLDNMVDYFTYVIVPAYFIYESGLVPSGYAVFTMIIIILASAYQFSQVDAKTPDHYFRGFPSYWNVVILYLFLYQWPSMVNFAILMALSVLVFVPIRYLYPSRTAVLRPLTYTLSLLWILLMIVIILRYEHNPWLLRDLSMLYVAYYFAMSLYLNYQALSLRRRALQDAQG